jgi:hypothetical protein
MKFRFLAQQGWDKIRTKVVFITAADMKAARERFYAENPGWDVSMLWTV